MEERTIMVASAYWLKESLNRPYKLSFGVVTAFDMIVVRLVDNTGQVGLGESCPIPPYSIESAAEVWARTTAVLREAPGRNLRRVLRELGSQGGGASAFSDVAALTAGEALMDPPTPVGPVRVPLVGTVLSSGLDDVVSEACELAERGYRTLKVKVGFDPADDLKRVTAIAAAVPHTVRLRLDANEAWDLPQTEQFLGELDGARVELLEQPFPRDRWDWVDSVQARRFPVPLMLDESIYDEGSVRRASDAHVGIVKFKLMKAGSRRRLRKLRECAESLGMSVVIGNGIAGVIDNWYEALCAGDNELAGEMNGHLKLADPVVNNQPGVEQGALYFPDGFALDVTEDSLKHKSVRVLRFS